MNISVLDKVQKPGIVSIDCGDGRFAHELDYHGGYSPDTGLHKSLVLDLASPLYNPGSKLKVYDRSPYRNIGTITGALWVWNGYCRVLDFDGDDYVTWTARVWGIANAWTVSLRTKPNDITTHMRALCFNDGAQNSGIRIIFNQYANGELRLLAYDDANPATAYKDYRANNVITATWQTLDITWDGTNLLGYRNATPITFTKTKDSAITMADRSRDCILGLQGVVYMLGGLDLPKVNNVTLSATQITGSSN